MFGGLPISAIYRLLSPALTAAAPWRIVAVGAEKQRQREVPIFRSAGITALYSEPDHSARRHLVTRPTSGQPDVQKLATRKRLIVRPSLLPLAVVVAAVLSAPSTDAALALVFDR